MKLLELAEKVIDPWDLAFAGLSYVIGFVVGISLAPAGVPTSELAALCATGGFSAKQVLWRMTARKRTMRRARRFCLILAKIESHNGLLSRVERELELLRGGIVNAEQAGKCLDTLIAEYRLPEKPVVALPGSPAATQERAALTVALPGLLPSEGHAEP